MSTTPDVMLGTAGHIDHGKSSLIRMLTGTDPDRLAEEKRRGITIELGFAKLALDEKTTLGVVDVPGHEKFVRQMISGATGIDLALLVIAADDGIMPQTREHLSVLWTLGITNCVVALTKIDLVEEDWVEFVSGEIEQFLIGTPFEGSPIVPVSSATGAGKDELIAALKKAAKRTHSTKHKDAFRMPIDRVFTIKGAGTVITGTLWSGVAHVGDEIAIAQTGQRVRIRQIQIHDTPESEAIAGNRVALNLAQISTEDVRPGDFLCAPELSGTTDRFDAELTYLNDAPDAKALVSGARVHVSHGTKEVIGRVLCMNAKESIAPGETTTVQIRLEEALPLRTQDRFVIRSYSPVRVCGGGFVLMAHPKRRTNLTETEANTLEALKTDNITTAAPLMAAHATYPICAPDIAQIIGCSLERVQKALDAADVTKTTLMLETTEGTYYLAREASQKLLANIEHILLDVHAKNPATAGIAKAELLDKLGLHVSEVVFDAILREAIKARICVITDGVVGHPSAQGAAKAEEKKLAQAILDILTQAGVQTPSTGEMATTLQVPEARVRAACTTLLRDGEIVRISKEILYAKNVVDTTVRALQDFLEQAGPTNVAGLKGVLNMSRKYAVPFLEYCDSIGATQREDDMRKLGKRI